MQSKDNKFQQAPQGDKIETFEQRIFSMEQQTLKDNHREQINLNQPLQMPELKKGSRGDMVMKAQRILKSTSDYVGYIDGDFGPFMESAVQSFQRRSKVPVNGIINHDTWNALNQVRC